MSSFVRALLVALIITVATAQASARGWQTQRVQTSYYYYPMTWEIAYPVMPQVYQPVQACPAPVYQPVPQQATPVPANPSVRPIIPRTTNEPPQGSTSRSPMVTESRSYYDSYGVVGGQQRNDGLHWVGFWNLSTNDVTLTVADRQVQIPRGRAVRLQLPRSFAWRVDNRAVENEVIPERDSAVEIVIRR